MTRENNVFARTIFVKGKIFPGTGVAAKFTKLPWVEKQIKEKLGFIPHPGTLNVRLIGDYVRIKRLLERARAIEILPEPGYCSGKCFRAYVMQGLECAVILPLVENYPIDVLEIIAPSNLREKLSLKDDDELEVKIILE